MKSSFSTLAYSRSPGAFETIVYGGLLVTVLDGLDAAIYFPLRYPTTPEKVFQSISAGLLGRQAASQGGWKTAVLGLLLHCVVAFGVATAFYFASRVAPFLYRQPWLSGPVFGFGVFLFMYGVVMPLSRIGPRTRPMAMPDKVDEWLAHMFLVGLPVALVARWSAKRNL